MGLVRRAGGGVPTTGGTYTGTVASDQGLDSDIAFASKVTGDAFNRVEITNGGSIYLGDGTAAPQTLLFGDTGALQITSPSLTIESDTGDINIASANAMSIGASAQDIVIDAAGGTLQVQGAVEVLSGTVTVDNSASADPNIQLITQDGNNSFQVRRNTDANQRYVLDAYGRTSWQNGAGDEDGAITPGNTMTLFADDHWESNAPFIVAGLTQLNGSPVAIGDASTDLIGFHGVTAVDQAAHIADPTGGAVQDVEARAALVLLLDLAEEKGLMSA